MKPEKEFRIDGVSASVWPRTVNGSSGTFITYSVKVERAYRDKDGQWQHSNNFPVEDLPKVETVAREAYKYVSLKHREPDREALESK